MQAHVRDLAIAAALLAPVPTLAQVYMLPAPAPRVTAAHEDWQRNSDPIFYAGALYYPSGPTEHFDGNIMARTGSVGNIPVYENKTLEPWSVVYVPIGGHLMRPYERRREGRLAGTVGSRTPGYPVQRDSDLMRIIDNLDIAVEDYETALPVGTSGRAQWDWPQPVRVPEAPPLPVTPGRATPSFGSGTVIRSLPVRETTNAGPFLQFDGTRYYSSGRAVARDPDRFTRVGNVGGATVYREVKGSSRTIYVEAVPGGLLAPYTRK